MFKSIKKLFIKETFSCIVWDGKIMRYLNLTQKQIDKMNNQNLNEKKKDEC